MNALLNENPFLMFVTLSCFGKANTASHKCIIMGCIHERVALYVSETYKELMRWYSVLCRWKMWGVCGSQDRVISRAC